MKQPILNMAEQIAQAAHRFQSHTTGHMPKSVSVVLSDETLVVTLHGALSPAEKALAKDADGAAQVQEFHRQLFNDSAESLRGEIKRITGVAVREAFTTGTFVQVFLLAESVPADNWSGSGSDGCS